MAIRNVLVLPDTHFPHEDRRTWRAVQKYIADHEWHEIVHLGDLGDFDQISKFQQDEPEAIIRSLGDDFAYINKKLDVLEKLAPKAKKTIIEGNHDFRVEQYILKMPVLRGVLDVPIQLHLKDRGKHWKWVPYWSLGKLHRIGNAYFGHGRFINKYHANKHVEYYGVPFYYGHTHDVQEMPKVLWGEDKTLAGSSLGCLCEYDQRYLKGTPTNWQQAIGVFRFRKDGFFNNYTIKIFKHQFVSPEGKEYSG
jgi:predicted phosphodiesterase